MQNQTDNIDQQRFARHLALAEVGLAGQLKLQSAKVLVVGAGGLGCPALQYLTAAGVGTIGICDHDTVDLSNLQRQVLFREQDIGRSKAAVATAQLQQLNLQVVLHCIPERVSVDNVAQIIEPFDLVMDGTDNFATKYLLNDACLLKGKTLVTGAIYRFEGQLTTIAPGRSPCWRCLSPNLPHPNAAPDCQTAGVLGILPGIIGTMQATEIIKAILELPDLLLGRLLTFDARTMVTQQLRYPKDPHCQRCGSQRLTDLRKAADYDPFSVWELDLIPHGASLLDVRTSEEHAIQSIPGSTLVSLHNLETADLPFAQEEEFVVYCKSGQRGRKALTILRQRGFVNARNLRGGIDAWRTHL